MAWLVSVLGGLLAAGGGYALWSGSGYIRLDWGQAETVAGTVALSGGVVTLGLAAVLFALRDLARRPAAALPAPPPADGRPLAPGAPPLRPSLPPEPTPSAPTPDAPAAGLPAEPVAEAPTVVGRYEANGASYVLFSDGTIEVETEHGTHRFASMAALRDHIDGQDAG